ncbi:caspase family protein [Desulfobacterales bacterium HSG2]|nr:caspase family protein [Desulfobacterales bacterium HSG2]
MIKKSNRKTNLFYLIAWLGLIFLLAICAQSCGHEPKTQPVITLPPTPPVTPSVTTTMPYVTTTQPTSPVIPSSSVSTLHLIIVADTQDYKIGSSVAADSRNMQTLIKLIAYRSNGQLSLNKIVFEGESITQQNMLTAIDSLRVGANDVIVFLYAGHGHRYTSTASKWPLMDTRNHPTDFLTVIKKISSKYSRQFIALADCCNEVVDRYRERVSLNNNFPYDNIKRMFLDSTAKISASGCKPGQFSYGDGDGGYFTSAFISNLRNALLSHGDWNTVLEKTRTDVFSRSGNRQEPQYDKTGN